MTKEKPTYTNVTWKPLDDPDKFRDMDRLEEAQRIPLTEVQEKNLGEEQDNPTLFELIKENPDMTYNEARKVQEESKLKEEAGRCITAGMKRDRDATDKMKNKKEFKKEIDYHRYWKDMYDKEHKLRQEAQGETTIIKGIGNTSPEIKALQKENKELKKELVQEKVDRGYDKAVHATELETLRKVK